MRSTLCALILALVASGGAAADVRLDVHSHGEWSDIPGDLYDSVKWHKNRGFDAMVVTNHNHLMDPQRLKQVAADTGFMILPGIEWSASECHLLALFNPDTYESDYNSIIDDTGDPFVRNLLEYPGNCMPSRRRHTFIDFMHAYGALIVAAHPTLTMLDRITSGYADTPCDSPGLLQLFDMGVDAIEVANTIRDFMAADFSEKFQALAVAGTDVHAVNDGMAVARTLVHIPNAREMNASILFKALASLSPHQKSMAWFKPREPVDPVILNASVEVEYCSWWGSFSDNQRFYIILSASLLFGFLIFFTVFIILGCMYCRDTICSCCKSCKKKDESISGPYNTRMNDEPLRPNVVSTAPNEKHLTIETGRATGGMNAPPTPPPLPGGWSRGDQPPRDPPTPPPLPPDHMPRYNAPPAPSLPQEPSTKYNQPPTPPPLPPAYRMF